MKKLLPLFFAFIVSVHAGTQNWSHLGYWGTSSPSWSNVGTISSSAITTGPNAGRTQITGSGTVTIYNSAIVIVRHRISNTGGAGPGVYPSGYTNNLSVSSPGTHNWSYSFVIDAAEKIEFLPGGQDTLGPGGFSNYPYELNGMTPVGKKMRWTIPANASPNPINWQVWKVADNSPVANVLQPAGAAETFVEITGPADLQYSDYVLKWWLPGLIFGAGGQWVVASTPSTNPAVAPTGGETVTTVTPPTPPEPFWYVVDDDGAAISPAKVIPTAQPTNIPTQTPGNTGGSVWRAGTGTGASLDPDTFREGVDKLIADRALAKKAEGAFDSAFGADGVAKTKGYGGTGTGAGSGNGAKDQIASAYTTPTGTMASVTTAPGGNSSPFALTVSFGTIDVDPVKIPQASAAMVWIKAMIAWTLTFVYSFWVFKHFRELTSVGAVPQLRGHDIALGAGGQASALGNAVIWTTVMLALPVAFTAALNSSGLSFPSVTGLLTTPVASVSGPWGTIVGYLIAQMIPWETLMLSLIGPLIIQAFSIPIYMGTQSAIRWLIG